MSHSSLTSILKLSNESAKVGEIHRILSSLMGETLHWRRSVPDL